ncbi:MAG: thiamine pyrophosphate-binding protein [Cyclobacteriaceae bacterium]
MIKVSDFIFKTLADHGVKHVFLVTGGGAMHLNDALGRETRIKYVCNHNEQASSIAAEGYARVSGTLGVVNPTSGPGGINTLNGVFGAFTDSIPMLVISGQVKRETLLSSYKVPGLRQMGDQEVEIVPMVKGITKYAVMVTEPDSIKYHLLKAISIATTGRPGPCWIDVPVDVQGALIDEDNLRGYDAREDEPKYTDKLPALCKTVLSKLSKSERPCIIASTGIRIAGAMDIFERVVNKLGIPITTAWSHDIIYSDHPLYCGKQGSIGDRAGNFTVQNSDLVLIIGSRMPIRQVSYNWENFAREAFKIQVDADEAELMKPTIKIDLPIHSDAKLFLEELERQLNEFDYQSSQFNWWVSWCKERVKNYPVLQAKHQDPNRPINPYYFLHSLQKNLTGNDVIVCGDATACIVTFQTSNIKKGQRLFSNSGCASMGFDLPAAIGAAFAAPEKRIICLAGDGSIQMNIQELQTIIHHKLPIKIFVLNNDGYLSIKSTQKAFFALEVGSSPESGVSLPDMVKVGNAYGFKTFRLEGFDFAKQLDEILQTPGPVLCDVVLDIEQPFEPKLSSKKLENGKMVSAPLEDMFPFLEKEELKQNLLIKMKEF